MENKDLEIDVDLTILEEANSLVNGARQEAYGHPYDNFKDIATIVSAMTGKTFTALDCVDMLIATKISREKTAFKRDNYVDAAGYFQVRYMVMSEMRRRGEA